MNEQKIFRLLIVEDEEPLAESLAFSLRKEGYRVDVALDGDAAMKALEEKVLPDLLLLDVMLPGKDGFEICRAIQKLDCPVPVIMITARGSEMDRVVGLELGADDYLVKPFSTRELEARIKAVLRRRHSREPKRSAEIEINLERKSVSRLGNLLHLSPKEWQLLKSLAERDGKIVSKEEILLEVWGSGFQGDPRTVEIYIHMLRQKLESDPANPRHIITVKRMGYRFEP